MFEEEDRRDREEYDFIGEEHRTEDNEEPADDSGNTVSEYEGPAEKQADSASAKASSGPWDRFSRAPVIPARNSARTVSCS